MGYAEKLGYDSTGYNPRENKNGWNTYTNSSALNNLKAGDIVRYKNNGHSIFVTAVNGDTVTYTDCNSDGHCIIRWNRTISKSTLKATFTHVRSAPKELAGNTGNNPKGCIDSVFGGTKTVSVRGWAYDADDVSVSICVDVYVGGVAGSSNAEGHRLTANVERTDVNSAFSVGNYHGFESTFSTSKTGSQPVYIYAINIGSGTNILLGSTTINIDSACDCTDSYKGDYTVTTNELPLTMRSGHGTSYSQITSIPKGSKVYVSKANGTWAHVEWNGYSGYCSMQYLTKENTPSKAPKIHAWLSEEKMGDVPENYKQGKMYYLCYELLDSTTGQRFEGGNNNYVITETLYGLDGGVANTCNYENSNNNWISYSSYTAGTYRGVVQISGAYEGSVEVSYTLDEIHPQLRTWISKEKMGEDTDVVKKGDLIYLCYEVRDKNSMKKINEKVEADYKVTETIYKPDGSVAHTCTYENSDYNWIGYKVNESGTYKCTVTISGAWIGSHDVEFTVTDVTVTPTITPTKKPTATPTMIPTKKPTVTPTVAPTDSPTITTKPTQTPFYDEADEEDDYDIYESEDDMLQKGDTFEVKSALYEVTSTSGNPTAEFVTLEKKSIKSFSIPSTVEYEGITYKVTGIAKSAFKNCKKLTSITIGSNVTYIGAYAFYKNSNLKKVTIKTKKLTKIQKKAFYGLPRKVTVKFPSVKKQQYKKLLKNAGLGKR